MAGRLIDLGEGYRNNVGALTVGPLLIRDSTPQAGIRSAQVGGNFYLGGDPGTEGIVTIDDVPAAREVLVFDRQTAMLVAKTMSKADGSWRVDNIRGDLLYMVMGRDQNKQENAWVMDLIAPVPMP